MRKKKNRFKCPKAPLMSEEEYTNDIEKMTCVLSILTKDKGPTSLIRRWYVGGGVGVCKQVVNIQIVESDDLYLDMVD